MYTEHDKVQGRKVAGKRDKWVASLRELEVLHVIFLHITCMFTP